MLSVAVIKKIDKQTKALSIQEIVIEEREMEMQTNN